MQQTGIPPIIMQHIIPGVIMVMQQSQQACIILIIALSPLLHIILQPISVISTLHIPIPMLQQHMHIPFIIMQQLII
jgi:hypothetical protein